MTKEEHKQLTEIVDGNGWEIHKKLLTFLSTVELTETPKGQRTLAQNRALHTYFGLVSDALNDAGLDIRAVLKQEVEIPWTPLNVKEYLWKPVQTLAVHKDSTRDLTKNEVSQVWEIFNRAIAKHGVHVPFPSDDFGVRMSALANAQKEDYPEHVKTSFE